MKSCNFWTGRLIFFILRYFAYNMMYYRISKNEKKSIFWKKHRPGVGSDLNDNVCAIFIIQVTCKNLGGHLAVIETPQENEFVSQEAYASPGEYISILYPPFKTFVLSPYTPAFWAFIANNMWLDHTAPSELDWSDLIHGMGFPTMWYVWPAKPQISLHIRAVWLQPLLVAWIFYEC